MANIIELKDKNISAETILGGKFLAKVIDCNTIRQTCIIRYSSSSTNKPISVGGGWMLTLNSDDDFIIQIAFVAGDTNKIYERSMFSNAWGKWKSITLS